MFDKILKIFKKFLKITYDIKKKIVIIFSLKIFKIFRVCLIFSFFIYLKDKNF